MSALQILIGLYVVINIISIIIAAIHYLNDRNSVQKIIMYYWIGHLIAALANGLFTENNLMPVVVGSFGIFVTNFFLGSFFAQIHRVKVRLWPLAIFYAASIALTWILSLLGASFVVYGTVGIVGCVSPLAVQLYQVLKHKEKKLTLTQKIFVGLCIFMIAHFFDYAFFRLNPDLFFIGTCVALAVIYILSILTPLMGTEYTLRLRNEFLEEEVKQKVEKLTSVEISLWESNKLASLGQLSGGVAHEINNPLQIITLYADALKTKAEKGDIANTEVIRMSQRIEDMVVRISKITESLRKIARDHRTVKMEEHDLIQIVKDTILLCNDKISSKKIQLTTNLPDSSLIIKCNSIEISQVILNLLNNSIDAVDELDTKVINLSVRQEMNKIILLRGA